MTSKIKRGTTREDGLVFICNQPDCKNGQFWGTPSQLAAYRKNDSERKRIYRKTNAEKLSSIRKKQHENNREKNLKRMSEFYKKNKDRVLKKSKERYLKVSKMPEYKKSKREYRKNYLSKNPVIRAIANSRSRIGAFIKSAGSLKTSKTMDMVGCSKNELKCWIKNQFQVGMSWDNYGKWHIDHMVPISSAACIEDVVRLCHFTNLQPLWARDNLLKGDRMFPEARAALQKEAIPVEVDVIPTPVVTTKIVEAK